MLAINGYYNGTNIVLETDIAMQKGQRVLVVLETPIREKTHIDLDKYVTSTQRGKNVEAYMEEMRSDDRI